MADPVSFYQQEVDRLFKIAGQAEKGYIFADIQPFEDTFEREVTGEKEGGSFFYQIFWHFSVDGLIHFK